MEKQNTNSSTNFWMLLAIMLTAFILIAGTLLVIANPFATRTVVTDNQQSAVTEQGTSQNTDHESVKDRVNAINGNYGQGIKDAYSGSNSAVEDAMRQRMFFSALKSILITILLTVAVVFVLIKCYHLIFDKKKAGAVDAGETEISVEEHKSSRPTEKKSGNKPKFKTETEIKQQQPNNKPVEEHSEDIDSNESDVEEVTVACQLP